MAGEKKSKNNLYFVGQYKNNPKVILKFASQYNKSIYLLGSNLSIVQSFNKSLKERSNQTVLFFYGYEEVESQPPE